MHGQPDEQANVHEQPDEQAIVNEQPDEQAIVNEQPDEHAFFHLRRRRCNMFFLYFQLLLINSNSQCPDKCEMLKHHTAHQSFVLPKRRRRTTT